MEDGHVIPTVQEPLGYRDVSTTMIYTHVLNRGPAAVRSSVDRMVIIGANEQEQTLNQILTETDGFSSREGIIVLAATHQPEVLDKALLRPGAYGLSGRSNSFVVAPSG